MKIDVRADMDANGNVVCDITCGGQQATVTFTGTEVLLEAPQPALETP